MNVIFRYPDGRTGQTTEEGFAAVHEEFGAEVTAYVGARGESYPATDEGRNMAEASAPNELTAYAKQVEALQAREATAAGAEDTANAEDLVKLAQEAAEAEKKALADAEAARVAAEKEAADAEEKAPAKGKGK